jgi:septal ring factor EnvC (AmiA/AmiB activator)
MIFPVLILTLIGSRAVLAQTPGHIDPETLEGIQAKQRQIEAQAQSLSKQQDSVRAEIGLLQRQLIKTADEARTFEKIQANAQARLNELTREQDSLTKIILADRNELADLLAALQRIERQPPPALLVSAQNATDAARAAYLISGLSHSLQAKSDVLKERLTNLETVRENMVVKQGEVTRSAAEVNTRIVGIKSIISDKTSLNNTLDSTRKSKVREADKLAADAKNLRDLIRSFEQQASEIQPRIKPPKQSILRNVDPKPRLKPKPRRVNIPNFIPSDGSRFSDARGNLPLPTTGKLIRKYGSRLKAGGRAKGVTLRTVRGAQVIAPFGGRVEFSGPFNDDQVVILNAGDGYFIVLTGLGEVYNESGITVAAGEPLGRMSKTSLKNPHLFLELRKNGDSIDPTPWIGPALAGQR